MKKIFLILTLIVMTFGLSGCIKINNNGGENTNNGGGTQVGDELTQDELTKIAKCLTEKGTKMYGAVWCTHCTAQKKAFGDAFQYVNYTECDPGTDVEGAKKCLADEIKAYPTWQFSDGSRRTGEIPPTELAELEGCL